MANQAIRQEINLICKPVSGSGTVNASELVFLDTTQYSGSPTYWLEIVHSGAASNTGTWAIVVKGTSTTISGATSATKTLTRTQITVGAAAASDINLICNGDGTRTQTCYAARIIILQSETTISQTETQIEIGNNTSAAPQSNSVVADITNPKFWKYNSANWDGAKTFSVEVVWQTSAKNTTTITLCRTSDNAANVTIVSAGTNSLASARTRVTFTPVNGETYKLRALSSSSKSTYTVFCGKIIVDQSATPTKLEPQALLLNTADAGTGAQSMLTTYTAAEWGVGTGSNTITHLVDSDNASNSAKIVTAAAADTGTSSAATGSVQPESASFSLIDATNYDTNVTNSTGTVAGSRLKFVYVFVAAAVVLPDLIMQPLLPAGRKL